MSYQDHNVSGCNGKWINISTIVNPSREKCSVCKAVRRIDMSIEEILNLDDEPSPSDPIEVEDHPTTPAIPTWAIITLIIANAALIVLIAIDVFRVQ